MQREKSGGGREGSRVSIVFFFLFFESSFLGFHLLCFFLCLCVLFFLEIEMFKEEENCVRTKKKRDKKRAHFALPTTSKTHTYARLFFVSRRGVVVVVVVFLLATQKRRGERETRVFFFICKDFRCQFFSLVECRKERGPRGRRDEIIIIIV